MTVVISHATALRFYFLCREHGHGRLLTQLQLEERSSLEGSASSRTGIPCDILNMLEALDAAGPGRPIDLLVSSRSQHYGCAGVHQHVWMGDLPRYALQRITGDVYVCAPEFVLLQMLDGLRLTQALHVGMQVCGTYALSSESPFGVVEHPKLTNLARLRRFSEGISRRRGLQLYRAITRYAIEGSASPMETAIALMLSLPARLGGYGLPPLALNVQVDYSPEQRRISGGRNFCKVDLLDSTHRFGWEYQGEAGHSDAGVAMHRDGHHRGGSVAFAPQMSYGASRLDRDVRKLDALAQGGFEVRPLVWGQVATPDVFDRVARETAQHMGIDVAPLAGFSNSARQKARRQKLHEGLFWDRDSWEL